MATNAQLDSHLYNFLSNILKKQTQSHQSVSHFFQKTKQINL